MSTSELILIETAQIEPLLNYILVGGTFSEVSTYKRERPPLSDGDGERKKEININLQHKKIKSFPRVSKFISLLPRKYRLRGSGKRATPPRTKGKPSRKRDSVRKRKKGKVYFARVLMNINYCVARPFSRRKSSRQGAIFSAIADCDISTLIFTRWKIYVEIAQVI